MVLRWVSPPPYPPRLPLSNLPLAPNHPTSIGDGRGQKGDGAGNQSDMDLNSDGDTSYDDDGSSSPSPSSPEGPEGWDVDTWAKHRMKRNENLRGRRAPDAVSVSGVDMTIDGIADPPHFERLRAMYAAVRALSICTTLH